MKNKAHLTTCIFHVCFGTSETNKEFQSDVFFCFFPECNIHHILFVLVRLLLVCIHFVNIYHCLGFRDEDNLLSIFKNFATDHSMIHEINQL